MNRRVDLLVVGAGPAGSTLASMASAAGARVALVERAAFPRDKVCGEFVSAEGCAVLSRIGLLARLRQAGAVPIDACRLTGPRGRARLDARLPELRDAGRSGIGISRSRLDSMLLELAAERGVAVWQRFEAVEPLYSGPGVRGARLREVGKRRTTVEIEATLVAAADGRRSRLARAIHGQRGDPDRSKPGSWFGLKTHLPLDPQRLGRRVELHLFDGGYAGLAAVEDGRANLCLMTTVRALRASDGSPLRLFDRLVLANPALAEVLGGARPCSPWKSIGPLRFGARRPAAAGALFVGDAAGTVDPFCGEGISNALRGAEIALPYVRRALERDGLNEALALGYRREWNREFVAVTRRVRRLGRLLEHPRLAGGVLGWLAGSGRRWAPRLVASTRTARTA